MGIPEVCAVSKPHLRCSLLTKQATLGLNLDIKKTRKPQFLKQMDQVVPWAALVELIDLIAP